MKIHFSTTFFSFLVAAALAGCLNGCQTDSREANAYFDDSERDTLLVNVITYMDRYARGATNQTRFEPRFRAQYVSRLPKFRFAQYFVAPDSTHYFFIIRPVGDGALFQRGVGGKFRIGANLMPRQFEEMWCTPHFKDEATIRERGGFLFKKMIENGNVNAYLGLKHYVEWPDSTLRYDKSINEWVSTRKL